jgi:diguanylate cyclase (GGDEF)-like protein
MQDFIMTSSTQNLAKVQTSPLATSQEARLNAQIKLLQALQINLDPQDQVNALLRHIQPIVNLSGIQLTLKNQQTYKAGRIAVHSCSYRLCLEDAYLGELACSRSRRFTDDEMMSLEFLMGSFAYALRNALRYQEALALALLDPLTLLGNRAALEAAIKRELPFAERHQQDLSILMIDVDYFKSINDTHGHDKGDQVLREIAKTLQTICRETETDMIYRYGGEEFLVILRNTGTQGAHIIAERLRQQVAKTPISIREGIICPTVSIGISSLHHGCKEKSPALFKRADKALYKAKAAGRNCVMEEIELLVG